jgi:hypothetical protein
MCGKFQKILEKEDSRKGCKTLKKNSESLKMFCNVPENLRNLQKVPKTYERF